jgi:excinuclease UvrABC nuclease subunit
VREPLKAYPSNLDQIPDRPAVFLLRAAEGQPYLARTALLRRRLKRILSDRERISRVLNLRGVVEEIDYWPTGSQIESTLLFVHLAQQHFPDDWQKIARLKPPTFLRLTLENQFPRTMITSRLTRGFFYGPFLTRAAAERFEQSMLDLFQLRRCEENLAPSAQHPGCIYGEMNKCLRPCQEIVSIGEYRGEASRVEQFLRTSGASLREPAESARDRASDAMQFEEAAQLHGRVERIKEVEALAGDLARPVNELCGVAVLPSSDEGCIELWFLLGGAWTEPQRLHLADLQGAGGSLDRELREVVSRLTPAATPNPEHLAILARWYGSSWRDGEWIGFESLEKMPYRRLVNAAGRVLSKRTQATT